MSSKWSRQPLKPGLQWFRLREAAAKRGGVVPVPFVGVTWQKRGVRYWLRRSVAWFTLLFGMVLCGGLAYGVTSDATHGVGLIIAVIYWATLIPGVLLGVRMALRGPVAPGRSAYGGGCGAILVAPFAAGVCLGYLVMSLGPEFPGESQARALTEEIESRGAAFWVRGDRSK